MKSINTRTSSLTRHKDVAKLSGDEQHQWRTAMQEEMDSLQDRKVWDLVDLPPGRTPVKGDGFMLSKAMADIRHALLQKDLHRSIE